MIHNLFLRRAQLKLFLFVLPRGFRIPSAGLEGFFLNKIKGILIYALTSPHKLFILKVIDCNELCYKGVLAIKLYALKKKNPTPPSPPMKHLFTLGVRCDKVYNYSVLSYRYKYRNKKYKT